MLEKKYKYIVKKDPKQTVNVEYSSKKLTIYFFNYGIQQDKKDIKV